MRLRRKEKVGGGRTKVSMQLYSLFASHSDYGLNILELSKTYRHWNQHVIQAAQMYITQSSYAQRLICHAATCNRAVWQHHLSSHCHDLLQFTYFHNLPRRARARCTHTHKLFWFRRTLRTNSFLAIVYVCTMGDMMPWREHASEFRHSPSDDDDKHGTFSLWLRFLIVLDLVSFLFPVEHWLRIHCGSA